ncbi:MAG: glycosyltransferase [bacterium]|nr:glycosyltransferase [bacterium]
MENKTPTVLFIVTFGAGLGHLAGEIGIAVKLRELSKETNIIFYTTSPATDALYSEGFYYYYIPSKLVIPKSISISAWERLYEHQLYDIVLLHKPQVIIYDGPYPEVSLIRILVEHPWMKGIWMKREGDRKDIRSVSPFERFFDLLIVPKELGEKNREITKKCKVISPIIYESTSKMDPSIKELFPEYKKGKHRIWYVQLGAGIINRIEDILQSVLLTLLEDSDNYILLGESPVSSGKTQLEYSSHRCKRLRSFPNSIYFNQIDYAISAAGYNTFYELVYYGVPAIFIPNRFTQKDDQVARAKSAEVMGTGLVHEEGQQLSQVIERLYKNKERCKECCEHYHFQNGAREAVELILQYT